MSSLSDARVSPALRGPRVGIMRGVQASDHPIVTRVRQALPSAVLDPIAVEEVRLEAERSGFDSGWQSGYAQGMAAARDEAMNTQGAFEQACRQVIEALNTAVVQLHEREVTSLERVADQTALLALQIAEVVLQREVATAVDPGRDAIARAITMVPEEGKVVVRLNPGDAQRLGDVEGLAPGRDMEFIPDPSVTPGGCILQVGATRIDAQIPAALGRIAEVLR